MAFLSAVPNHINLEKLRVSLRDTVVQNWYLGFTSFGGPAVHFQIVRFVAFLCFLCLADGCLIRSMEGKRRETSQNLDIRSRLPVSEKLSYPGTKDIHELLFNPAETDPTHHPVRLALMI